MYPTPKDLGYITACPSALLDCMNRIIAIETGSAGAQSRFLFSQVRKQMDGHVHLGWDVVVECPDMGSFRANFNADGVCDHFEKMPDVRPGELTLVY